MTPLVKPFLTIDEQIELLKKRDLIIENDEEAYKLFRLHSYYSVINGYKDIFLCPVKTKAFGEDRFKENVNLKDIINLFNLDIQFRKEILSILEVVESVLSNNIAYILGERYGHQKEDYLKKSNFKRGRKIKKWDENKVIGHEFEIDRLFRKLEYCYESNEHPMKHYREKHKFIPPWVLVKGLTFRNLFYIYKLFKNDDKTYLISRCTGITETHIDNETKEFFIKSLDLMIYYRNWAAHGNRIFSYKTRTELPYYEPAFIKCNLTNDDYKEKIGINDIFALSIALRFFLQNSRLQFEEYYVSMAYYLEDYKERNREYYNLVLKEMGFPENYYELMMNQKEKEPAFP